MEMKIAFLDLSNYKVMDRFIPLNFLIFEVGWGRMGLALLVFQMYA